MNRKSGILAACSRGIGSILDIAPTSNYARFVPRESFNERLHTDFLRVGGALRHGIETFERQPPQDDDGPKASRTAD